MSENIVAVSLFSGAGGLDIASFMAGVPVISSTDFDADCIATLRANENIFGKTEIFEEIFIKSTVVSSLTSVKRRIQTSL